MINIILILAVFIFTLLILGFRLDERHAAFKFLSLFFAVIGLIIIGYAGIESKQVCSIEIANATVTGNITSYNYNNYCFDSTTHAGSSGITFKIILSYVALLFTYLIVFLFKFGGDYLKQLIGK